MTVGEVLGQPVALRKLTAKMGEGLARAAGGKLDHAQAITYPGQRLAIAGIGRELGQ